eukprot:scpid93324/ scgid20461/ 
MTEGDVLARLTDDSQHIKTLLKLIPVKFYCSTGETEYKEGHEPWIKKANRPAESKKLKQQDQKKKQNKAEKGERHPEQQKSAGKAASGQGKSKNAAQKKAVKPAAEGDSATNGSDSAALVYNKIDVTDRPDDGKKFKKKRDLKKLISKAEKRQQRLEELKTTDKDAAQEKEKTATWNRAMRLAEGVKLKDDPKLLKKSLKKKEKIKQQSKKKWQERVSMQKKKQQDASEKRQTNIKKRIQDKKEKKQAKRDKRR